MAGGLIALLTKKFSKSEAEHKNRSLRGILFSSGIVAGDALIGVTVAFMIGAWTSYREFYDSHDGMMVTLTGSWGPWVSLLAFTGLVLLLANSTRIKKKIS